MTLKKKPKDRAKKKSVSFPPDLWEYIELKAGPTGVPARIVQEAVRLMMREDPDPKGTGSDAVLKKIGTTEDSPTYGKKKSKS